MLGENIRRIRTSRHLTQSALAEKSGVSVQQINQIEWGAKGLSVPTLVRIARALEYDMAHPGEPPRTAWSDWKTDQAFWCRGGTFYPAAWCEHYVKYTDSHVECGVYRSKPKEE